MKPNFAINHIGINVPHLDDALAWYVAVLGFQVIQPAIEVTAGEGDAGTRFTRINGPKFGRARAAYLTSANGVGLEMFEFIQPRTEPFADDWEFWQPGIWHICITAPDVAELAAWIVAHGGRQRTDVVTAAPGSEFRLTFCQDPWGNPIEVMNASYDRLVQAG